MPYAVTNRYRRRKIPPGLEIGRAVPTNEERVLVSDKDSFSSGSPLPYRELSVCPLCGLRGINTDKKPHLGSKECQRILRSRPEGQWG